MHLEDWANEKCAQEYIKRCREKTIKSWNYEFLIIPKDSEEAKKYLDLMEIKDD